MSTPKRKYRSKKKLKEENIKYSPEEAEYLGLDEASVELDSSEYELFTEEDDLDEVDDSFVEKKPVKAKTKKADKAKFYVDPKEFDTKIMEYYNSGVLSDSLAEMVSKIAHKLSYAPNFINYSYREEMVGDGIIRMFKALMSKKYDHTKGTNPFSYFTRIAFNAFRNRIKKEKHIHETHEKYQEEFLLFSENYSNLVKNNRTKFQKRFNE